MKCTCITIPYAADNYAFLLLCDSETKFSVLIDAGSDREIVAVLSHYPAFPLKAVCLTHFHHDHVDGLPNILSFAGNPAVFGHHTKGSGIKHYYPVKENSSFSVESLAVKTLGCQSHAPDHLAFMIQDKLFCGDILFSAGCGRFFSGSGSDLLPFIEQINTLPESTGLYFGHEYTLSNLAFAKSMEPENRDIIEYIQKIRSVSDKPCSVPSTLGLEKKINPYLRYADAALLKHPALVKTAGNPALTIDTLRHLKDTF